VYKASLIQSFFCKFVTVVSEAVDDGVQDACLLGIPYINLGGREKDAKTKTSKNSTFMNY